MAKKKDDMPNMANEKIIVMGMDEVMHASMMPYAEHVILERALPRVEDGLKPVQRRILYTMHGLSVTPDKPHRKSARIVGDCLGKYHPHGDSSVYDAMVRMAQGFNMQMQLVDGHGNFGSVDGDSAAAMRYTEVRMTPVALELLRDLDKDTVKFSLNFDDSLKEPDLLPARFPNLLVNGSSGIAVGLATNIPPHNLGEAVDAVIAQMENPDITLDELMRIIPCPDFPTGAYIINNEEIRAAYESGRGKITVRAKAEIEDGKNGKKLIAITEFPYQVNKARALEEILRITQEKKALFAGVGDIRDESDRTGIRAVVEVKKDYDAEKILQYLYKYSDIQTTFGVNIVAIAEGKPQQLGLKEIIRYYILHQENVVTRRTQFELDAAEHREHILEGLNIALLDLDEVIALIRASKTPKTAKEGLMERFSLSEIQAQAILDLRLQRLTNLEHIAIEREYEEVKKAISRLRGVLASKGKLHKLIKDELREVSEKHRIPRRTQLLETEREIVVPESEYKVVEDVVITILDNDRVRRTPKRSNGIALGEDERALAVFDTQSDQRIRLFTNQGTCFTLPVEDIPETKATGRPSNINSLIALNEGEKTIAWMNEIQEGPLFFFTKQGMVKRTDAKEYVSRTKRIQAISLKDGDELIGVQERIDNSILLVTKRGMSICFDIETVPEMGRVSGGVKCIKLDAGDAVAFFEQIGAEGEIVTITDRGYAKRSFAFDYDLQGRNGKGLKAFDFKKNGSNGQEIAGILYVKEPYDFVVEQFYGTKSSFSTENVMIEARAGRGMLLVMAMLDDVVTAAYKKN